MSDQYEVIIVGGGPAGLAAARTLAAYDVRTLVIERRPEPSSLPRATVASTATMELMRRWGLEDEVWARALEVEWRAWACPTLASADGQALDVGMPTAAQASVVSPTAPACISQDELEPLLERGLDVRRGVEVLALRALADGYELELSAAPWRVRARYVIGADGIRSSVRTALGIASDGEEDPTPRVAAIFRAPLWDVVGDRRYGIYFVGDGATVLPAGKPDRWILGTQTADDLEGQIRAAAGVPDLPVAIERQMTFTFGTALAERWREGGVFLIGDAAHRVTPRGGTGLNAAVRDGFDLGWKLGWVLRGWADDALLDTFERERRPVAEHNLGRSMREDGSLFSTAAGLQADVGGRIPHVWAAAGRSTLDLLGDGITVFAGPDWDGDVPYGGPPVTVARIDAFTARALGLAEDGALVARPDGRPLALLSSRACAVRGKEVASTG